MPDQHSEEELYRLAQKRVEEKKGFFIHFSIYVIVNVFLIVIWAVTYTGFPWFVFPLFGWGIGVLVHFLSVFVFAKQGPWERREIDKEVERLRGGKSQ